MKKYIVKNDILSKLKELNPETHSESTLYIYGDELLKMLNATYLDRKQIIEELSYLDNPHLVLPEYMVYKENGDFAGYGMHYYKDYQTFYSLINNPNVSFKDKINILKTLSETFHYLLDNGLIYKDIHFGNLLSKDKDLKLIDMDSVIPKSSIHNAYNVCTSQAYNRLALISLGLLYDVGSNRIRPVLNKNRDNILNGIPSELKEYFKYAIDDPYNHMETMDYLDLFDEEIVNQTRHLLK